MQGMNEGTMIVGTTADETTATATVTASEGTNSTSLRSVPPLPTPTLVGGHSGSLSQGLSLSLGLSGSCGLQ
jgi:hypothetical protein